MASLEYFIPRQMARYGVIIWLNRQNDQRAPKVLKNILLNKKKIKQV